MTIPSQQQQEWATWKYFVMSRSQQQYNALRQLFSDNQWTPEKEQRFRAALKIAQQSPGTLGSLRNAYQHVWGYFKAVASPQEKRDFQQQLAGLVVTNDSVKPLLIQLTLKYQIPYLLASRLLFEHVI